MDDEKIDLKWSRFYGWFALGIGALILAPIIRELLARDMAIIAAGLFILQIAALVFYMQRTKGRDEFEQSIALGARTYAGLLCIMLAAAAPIIAALGWMQMTEVYGPLALPGLFIMFATLSAQFARWQMAQPEKVGVR